MKNCCRRSLMALMTKLLILSLLLLLHDRPSYLFGGGNHHHHLRLLLLLAADAAVSTPPNFVDIKVACVGDSITDGSCCGLRQEEIYPVRLQEILLFLDEDHQHRHNFVVTNYGILSRTGSKDCIPSYWDSVQYAEALTDQPDIVLVMLGTNDAKVSNWGPNNCAKTFADDMTDLWNSFFLLTDNPVVVVYAILPPRVCPNPCCGITDNNMKNGVIPSIENAATAAMIMSAAGQQQQLHILDAYTYTEQHCSDWYRDDGVHLNALGAQKLAEFFANAILLQNSTNYDGTDSPSFAPSNFPTTSPSETNQMNGTNSSSMSPSNVPTTSPSESSAPSSFQPTVFPTEDATFSPSATPTKEEEEEDDDDTTCLEICATRGLFGSTYRIHLALEISWLSSTCCCWSLCVYRFLQEVLFTVFGGLWQCGACQ